MIPLVLNTAEPMVKVRVMTVKDHSEKTLKTLHRVGVLHVEESKELKPADREAIEQERREVSELLTFVDNVLSYLPQEELVSLAQDIEVIYTRPFSEIGNEVRVLYNKLEKLHERTVRLDEETKELTEIKKYLEPLAEQASLRLRDLSFSGDYLFSRIFLFPSETYEALSDRLKDHLLESIVTTVDNETIVYAIAKVTDQKTIESIVTDAGGNILPLPDEDIALGDFLEATGTKIHNLEEERTKLYEELQSKAREDLDKIILLREALSAENERLSVLEKASDAKYVTLIEGWIPETSVESAISEVKESLEYVFINTRKPESQEEPPIKLKNLKRIKPFETVVNLFATPKYREWDPTPIVAYSFAFFFGLMAADVIYALGIIAAAKFLLPKLTDDPYSDGFKLFQKLIYTCGGVALVVGLLTGSYLADLPQRFFGIGSLALVKGLEQMLQNPMSFIILALIIGLIHVNIGHLLALIKGIKEKDKGAVLSKIGLFSLQFGIPSILHSLLHVDFPFITDQVYSILLYIMLGSVVLIAVSAIMQRGGLGAILWLFDITGLLGDVMSYSRLAGVGLATFYLGQSFNMLADLFRGMLPGTIGAILGTIVGLGILIFGHVINLILSGITGFIHSLRLCFVEFLFKFYEGGGREYSPFKLRKRATVPISVKS